ncbi:MAG: hypothetical protein Q4B68_02365 [Bacteroidales bacterium]|nr:hypothetical protein [Bacteroidales bacterium]
MVFHDGFFIKRGDILVSPGWFEQRAELYKKVAMWQHTEKSFDEIFFHFTAPDCGWMDVAVYVNGKRKHVFSLTAAFDSLDEIRVWLEDIVNDTKLSSDLYLDLEGRTVILHYEHIRLAEVGVSRKFVNQNRDEDEWESFDANNGAPDTGLFYLYDSDSDDIPVVCYCLTKQFLFSMYNNLMYYSSKGEYARLIGKEWYYLDHDKEYDNWTFYNRLKSSLIEWNQDSRRAYRHCMPKFRQTPIIKETVHMWAEWEDALFWHQRGGRCGNAESFFVDTNHATIDLRDLPEVREWYDEFNNRIPEEKWPDDEFEPWFNKGYELAKKIRQRLPLEVDLFYHWKSFSVEGANFSIDIPILVPDNRLLITKRKLENSADL